MGRTRPRPQHLRLILFGVILVAAWVFLGFRLFEVQGMRGEELGDLALEQRLRTVELPAARGAIVDRDGRQLAVSIQAVSVYANPQEVEDAPATAALIAPILGRPEHEVRRDLSSEGTFVYLARKLRPPEAEQLQEMDLPGIHYLSEPARVYPSGSLAAQVLGFVGLDNYGLEGLERQYDEVLSGVPGEIIYERSGRGQVIPQGQYQARDPEPGDSIRLTIDAELQFMAEKVAAETLESTGSNAVHIVVLDVETSDVLAMVTSPSFDPNSIGTDPALFRNRSVTDIFEPGSTQKLVTVAAAIEEGVVTPDRVFEVADEIEVYDREYFDFTEHEVQEWTVADIVSKSSNVGTILIWQELGDELLFRYLQGFGLGVPTGIDFPGEATGLLRPAEEWCDSCGASTSIGYRVSVTPLQMTSVFSAVANDGVLVQPRLVQEIIGTEASHDPIDQTKQRVLSIETAGTMRRLLAGVVAGGTGTRAAVPGYSVAGKTGTTRKFDETLVCEGNELPGCYGDQVVASFIGIAPVSNPRLAIGVFVDSPTTDKKTTGGTAAAPAFAEIMQFALHQLGVPPDGS